MNITSYHIEQLGVHLPLFKKHGSSYNFRCIVCGDSKKDKTKARGYILQKGNGWIYYCHNCNHSSSVNKFIKEKCPDLYSEILRNDLRERKIVKKETVKNPIKFDVSNESILHEITTCCESNPSISQYLKERNIPKSQWFKIRAVTDYKKFMDDFYTRSKLEPKTENGKTFNLKDGVIFPLYNTSNNFVGWQYRNINGKRFFSIHKLLDAETILFNRKNLNMGERIYVTEGAFDSLFFENSIATLGVNKFHNSFVFDNRDKVILVYDGEPRNKQIVETMKSNLDLGYKIFIMPKELLSIGKDINDLVNAGMKISEIREIVVRNSFEGIMGKSKLARWIHAH